MVGGRLPKNWIDCPPHGSPIDSFIPFKVPLARQFNSKLPNSDSAFGLSDVMALEQTFGIRVCRFGVF